MSVNVAGVTVTEILLEANPRVAVIVAVPGATAVKAPPPVGFIIVVSLEVQVAVAVRSGVVPSELLPVAFRLTDSPTGTGGRSAGVMAMPSRTGAPTVSMACPEIVPSAASIAALAEPAPAATAVAHGIGWVPGAAGRLPSQTSRTIYACWPPFAKN